MTVVPTSLLRNQLVDRLLISGHCLSAGDRTERVQPESLLWGLQIMANPLMNQDALFNQYESEYCSKSTDITRKIQALSTFSAGSVP